MKDEKDETEKIRKNFLKEIGFTFSDELIGNDEFDPEDYDFVDAQGVRSRGPDFLFCEVLEEKDFVEIEEKNEIDDYWSRGWTMGYGDINRTNYDSFRGRYYKSFPSRIRLSDFEFTKSLRRVLQTNADLKWVIRPLRITPEKMKLHERHFFARYGEFPPHPLTETYKYIKHFPSELKELCVFQRNELAACSIFEMGEAAMLSNQAFWAISHAERSLGTLTILLEIQHALAHDMDFYYMGGYYKQNPLYHYKARFQGFELMDWEDENWIPFAEAGELLKQKLPRKK